MATSIQRPPAKPLYTQVLVTDTQIIINGILKYHSHGILSACFEKAASKGVLCPSSLTPTLYYHISACHYLGHKKQHHQQLAGSGISFTQNHELLPATLNQKTPEKCLIQTISLSSQWTKPSQATSLELRPSLHMHDGNRAISTSLYSLLVEINPFCVWKCPESLNMQLNNYHKLA